MLAPAARRLRRAAAGIQKGSSASVPHPDEGVSTTGASAVTPGPADTVEARRQAAEQKLAEWAVSFARDNVRLEREHSELVKDSRIAARASLETLSKTIKDFRGVNFLLSDVKDRPRVAIIGTGKDDHLRGCTIEQLKGAKFPGSLLKHGLPMYKFKEQYEIMKKLHTTFKDTRKRDRLIVNLRLGEDGQLNICLPEALLVEIGYGTSSSTISN